MTEHRSVRYGILGVVVALALGLVWLGVVRYQAEQRARAAAMAPAVLEPAAAVESAAAAQPPVPAPAPEAQISVHVAGAVGKPGVYKLDHGARVIDAIAAAGGALPEGVPDALNLAALVEDGQKVFVSTKQELASPPPPVASGATYTPYSAPAAASAKAPVGKVNVNTATVEQLDQVSGLSPAQAKAIVDYRTKNGPFKKLEDLTKVTGIKSATFTKVKDHLTL